MEWWNFIHTWIKNPHFTPFVWWFKHSSARVSVPWSLLHRCYRRTPRQWKATKKRYLAIGARVVHSHDPYLTWVGQSIPSLRNGTRWPLSLVSTVLVMPTTLGCLLYHQWAKPYAHKIITCLVFVTLSLTCTSVSGGIVTRGFARFGLWPQLKILLLRGLHWYHPQKKKWPEHAVPKQNQRRELEGSTNFFSSQFLPLLTVSFDVWNKAKLRHCLQGSVRKSDTLPIATCFWQRCVYSYLKKLPTGDRFLNVPKIFPWFIDWEA